MHDELSLRAAGRVERYHTWPTIQRQTVAEHTWQVMRIWFELFGYPPSNVIIAILLHDVGEIRTGDLPFSVKQNYPALKGILTKIEDEHISQMVAQHYDKRDCQPPIISQWDKTRIKICDLLEMGEFALDEHILGNRAASGILRNVQNALELILYNKSIDQQDVSAPKARLVSILDRWNGI